MEVSAEVHFAQTLASNDKKFRDRALKRLRKYIGVRCSHGEGLSHDDFIKIWKGLHYCMWMQDKPLIQEELSEKMANLLHAFPRLKDALSFVNVFFITEAREWGGIDRLRLDKFMMLIRGILHETFVLLSQERWPVSECQSLSSYLISAVMDEDNSKIPYGIKLHIADIYMTEMGKVSLQGINGKKLTLLMVPFIYFLLKTKRYELAQTVFEKTIQFVLRVYGKWAWQQSNRRKKKRKGASVAVKKDTKIDDDDDLESSEESDDEKEESEGEDDDVDEKMEVDDNANVTMTKRKKLKFDLSNLLRLMQVMAEDPKVESRNRTYVYGIVRSYTCRDPRILQTDNSVKNDVDDDEDDDDGDVDFSTISQIIGKTDEKRAGKKKRKRRRRKGEEDFDGNNINESKKIEINSADDISKSNSQHQNMKNIQEQISPAKHKTKKRKRISTDGESNTDAHEVKKLKTGDMTIANQTSGVKETSETSLNQSPSSSVKPKKKHKNKRSDSNSNAGSPAFPVTKSMNKKTAIALSSPIQYVIYPQKSPKIVGLSPSANKYSPMSMTDSSPKKPGKRKDAESSAASQPDMCNMKSPLKVRDNANTSEPVDGGKGNGGGVMDSLYNVMATPCYLVKKAVGMIAPASEPASSKDRTADTPNQMTDTPSQTTGPKKVVFDLRKNKANKFQDYLKSLAKEPPSPAFEPTKSPSQGILKSPSSSSILSSSEEVTPQARRRGGKSGSPKMAGIKLKSPKTRKSLSPATKRKSKKRSL